MDLSTDTQAVLMLCSWLGQRATGAAKPLTPSQYATLARWLRDNSLRPADLLAPEGRERLKGLVLPGVSRESLEHSLDRGAALGIMIERWESRGIWVISRSDREYPARYKQYLGQASPPLLYGVGERSLLNAGGIAIVGSRDASEEDLDYARRVASVCAAQSIAVISGAAKGIDAQSMESCLEAGGRTIGVLAEGLGRTATQSRYYEPIIGGRLTLVTPYDPDARWFAHNAMERNKFVYGLADAALVVASAAAGGTWNGATEALKLGRVPVYVKATGSVAPGNKRLLAMGALPLPPEPWNDLANLFTQLEAPAGLFSASEFTGMESVPESNHAAATTAGVMRDALISEPGNIQASPQQTDDPNGEPRHDSYALVLDALLEIVQEPRDERSVAEHLRVMPAQAKAWLKRAVQEGKVKQLRKPLRYVTTAHAESLFH